MHLDDFSTFNKISIFWSFIVSAQNRIKCSYIRPTKRSGKEYVWIFAILVHDVIYIGIEHAETEHEFWRVPFVRDILIETAHMHSSHVHYIIVRYISEC